MMGFLKNAVRRMVLNLAAGESGWITISGGENAWDTAGSSSTAGQLVNGSTAMQLSAFFDCVRKTSQTVASLPLALYEKQSDGSRVKIDHDLSEILTVMPNRDQTAFDFWEGVVAHMVMRGNGISEKLIIGSRVVGYRPLLNATCKRDKSGALVYSYSDRGKQVTLPPEKVLHMRGFGVGDGVGLSAIKYGTNSLGSALAADETAGSVFANAMMPSGVVQANQTLDPDQRAQLQTYLETYTGSKKAGKVMTLEGGLTYSQVQMNPEDAQLLETRRFSVEDVCRWTGTPPIIIGHSAEGQTMWGTGVESIFLSWLALGINPLLRKIEGRLLVDVIPPEKRKRWYFEFNREAMLQMDSVSKGEFLSKMGSSGTMTANERRQKLNLPKHEDPGADALLAQRALAPLELLGEDVK